MFKVSLVTYRNDETIDEKADWLIADEFGEYTTQTLAERVAAELTTNYYEFVALYCATHECDGIAFDVVDTARDEAVVSYEITAAGQVEEWRETECHGWKVV